MTAQGDHIVLKCSSDECGMRYPSPLEDPRREHCPLCEAPVHQVAVFAAPPEHMPSRSAQGLDPTDGSSLVAVLDNVRSALNVGTMLRSADGAALDHVYLGGLTASADHPKVAKTALGAQQSVATTSRLDISSTMQQLHDDGYRIWAVDFTMTSVSLQSISQRPERLAFVVGNELAGVDPDILTLADQHVHLDMHGEKSTLNVGVTFGIFAHWLRVLPTA